MSAPSAATFEWSESEEERKNRGGGVSVGQKKHVDGIMVEEVPSSDDGSMPGQVAIVKISSEDLWELPPEKTRTPDVMRNHEGNKEGCKRGCLRGYADQRNGRLKRGGGKGRDLAYKFLKDNDDPSDLHWCKGFEEGFWHGYNYAYSNPTDFREIRYDSEES